MILKRESRLHGFEEQLLQMTRLSPWVLILNLGAKDNSDHAYFKTYEGVTAAGPGT